MAQILPLRVQLLSTQTGLTLTHRVLNLDFSEFAAAVTGLAETAVAGQYKLSGGYSAPDAGGYVEIAISAGALLGVADIDPASPTVAQIQSGLATAAALATVQADTDNIQTRLPAVLVGGLMSSDIQAVKGDSGAANNLEQDYDGTGYAKANSSIGTVTTVTNPVIAGTISDKTGYSLSAAGIQAIWDALTSALVTVGSIGKLLVDNINATIGSRATPADVAAALTTYGAPTFAELDARTDAIDAAIVSVQVDTDAIQTAIAALNNLSQAQAQTAATAAIVAYDPPTEAEMNAAFAALDDLSAVQVQAAANAALVAYGAATGADVAAIDCPANVIGAIEFTYTVTDSISSAPIEGVQTWISTDIAGTNVVWYGVTDALGVLRDGNGGKPFLDAGQYFFVRQKTNYSFTNPDTEVVG